MNESSNDQNSVTKDQTAVCCAQFYEQDFVQEMMGGSYHPGGEELSSSLVRQMQLAPGSSVLDVACGVGTMVRLMAVQFGLHATGLDFSAINVTKARDFLETDPRGQESQTCCEPGEACCSPGDGPGDGNGLVSLGGNVDNVLPGGKIEFVQGSADSLPFDDASFDGVSCECAVSTFANQQQAASEFYRVLRPGGVFGMTDMVLNGELPAAFAETIAPWTCVANALTIDGYRDLFAKAGFRLRHHQDCSDSLLTLATEMKRKLVMAGMGKALGALPSMGMDIPEMREMLRHATDLVRAGTIQYGLMVFEVGNPG